MTARENFPVGSLLIRADLRPAVAAFYAFARGADDAADDPQASPGDRLARLAGFEAGLDGGVSSEGAVLRERLAKAGCPGALRHARQLLAAFRADAVAARMTTWADLLNYCEDSANPVGRFLLDLHGEDQRGRSAGDALCTALQVLNHLQDLKSDHLTLDRLYLPADWMEAENAREDDLAGQRLTPALRRVVDRTLDACDDLLDDAAALPGLLASRRLAAEVRAIHHLARRLSARLRVGDPLAVRIRPGRGDALTAAALGVWRLVGLPPRGRAVLQERA